jgi:hypothetical protein
MGHPILAVMQRVWNPAEKRPFLAKTMLLGAKKGAKSAVCSYLLVNRQELQAIDFVRVASNGRVEKRPPQGRGVGVSPVTRPQATALGRPEWDIFLHSSIVRAGREMICKRDGELGDTLEG